jgi:hypothetical protein
MNTTIDRIIDFIAERDPPFPRQIEGAPAEAIERLETAVGRPLPAVYRRFLERMGRRLDWLTLADARFDIDSLIKYYEFAVLPDPAGYLLIGRSNGDPYYDVYLWEEGPGSLRVVSFPPPPLENVDRFFRTNLRRMAGSLPQRIGDAALSTFRDHRLPWRRQIESAAAPGAAPRLEQLDALLASASIAPLWYSNDWMRTYESVEAVITAYEVPGNLRLIVDLRAATQNSFDKLLPPLRDFVKQNQTAPGQVQR